MCTYIHRNVNNLIFESKSALQLQGFLINCIGKGKLKHCTTELFRKGLVVLSRQVHETLFREPDDRVCLLWTWECSLNISARQSGTRLIIHLRIMVVSFRISFSLEGSHFSNRSSSEKQSYFLSPRIIGPAKFWTFCNLSILLLLFCVSTKKTRDYYSLLISKKAKLPNAITFLHRDFSLSEKQLQQAFLLPHKVALEPYVRAFQYKVLNRILYPNKKLYKIGFISHKDCTFCKSESETLTHLLYHCPFSIAFWRDFEAYWSMVRDEQIHLTLSQLAS